MVVITVAYWLYTDGDYSLQNPHDFGCTGLDVMIGQDYYNYTGLVSFSGVDDSSAKSDAKTWLKKFLCDGIHVSYPHYGLLSRFCTIIDELLAFITDSSNKNDSIIKSMGGSHEGSHIVLSINYV